MTATISACGVPKQDLDQFDGGVTRAAQDGNFGFGHGAPLKTAERIRFLLITNLRADTSKIPLVGVNSIYFQHAGAYNGRWFPVVSPTPRGVLDESPNQTLRHVGRRLHSGLPSNPRPAEGYNPKLFLVNPNPIVAPGVRLQQAAYNTAVMGRAYSQIPPYILGYNPYPLSVNYGPVFNPYGFRPQFYSPYGPSLYGNVVPTGVPYAGGYSPYVAGAPVNPYSYNPYAGGYGGG